MPEFGEEDLWYDDEEFEDEELSDAELDLIDAFERDGCIRPVRVL